MNHREKFTPLNTPKKDMLPTDKKHTSQPETNPQPVHYRPKPLDPLDDESTNFIGHH